MFYFNFIWALFFSFLIGQKRSLESNSSVFLWLLNKGVYIYNVYKYDIYIIWHSEPNLYEDPSLKKRLCQHDGSWGDSLISKQIFDCWMKQRSDLYGLMCFYNHKST